MRGGSTWLYIEQTLVKDLMEIGLTPRKSLTIQLPTIPDEYFYHFTRGYIEGDGWITREISKPSLNEVMRIGFASGSHDFFTLTGYKN
jgi:hypothetical protein